MTVGSKSPIGVTNAAGTSARFELGEIACGDENAAEKVYVKATTAITAKDFVTIDGDFNAAPATKTNVDKGYDVGVAEYDIALNSYGFVVRSGRVTGYCLKACAPSVPIFTTATAGAVDDATTSQTQLRDVIALTTATATGSGAVEFIINKPRSTTF